MTSLTRHVTLLLMVALIAIAETAWPWFPSLGVAVLLGAWIVRSERDKSE